MTETPEQLNRRVKSGTINFAAHSGNSVALFQSIPPANIYAANNDNAYMRLSPAYYDLNAENVCLVGLSVFDAIDIESGLLQRMAHRTFEMDSVFKFWSDCLSAR